MSLHRQFQEVGLKLANTSLLASHPVYDYLERAYDLNLMSMHWEPDQFPSEEEWRVLDQLLLTRPSGWMLWEAPPLESTIKALEARQIKVVVILPQGGDAGGVDFMQIVKDNLDALASIKP
jgi:zinc transport system substrate-binding protein